jgi:hypothetical protein
VKNLKTTPWTDTPQGFNQAKIYKTQGGKIAVQIVHGYGRIIDGQPSAFVPTEPRYYQTVLGAYDKLEAEGFGDVVTVDDIRAVLNGVKSWPTPNP